MVLYLIAMAASPKLICSRSPLLAGLFNLATALVVLSPKMADIPVNYIRENGEKAQSKTVGLVDAPGNRIVFSLFDAGQTWTLEMPDGVAGSKPAITRFNAGKAPYDSMITPDGRYYIAGLFGEDGLSMLDLWDTDAGVTEILPNYGKGEQQLPDTKCRILRAGRSWVVEPSCRPSVTTRCW